ncbi:MAG: tetratricopeptide repeat protein [Acidobacteriota bacterium]|nr:tetratricopeptide repeat protein [Acidobacteriota bacterium]
MISTARRCGLLGGLVLALAAHAAFGQTPEPPVADGRDMEPQVSLLLDRLVEALRARPADPARWLEYGETLHAHGLVSDAAECYRAALELLPAGDVTRLTARYLLAHALRGADRAGAAEVLEAAVAEHPGYPPSLLFLGELLEELGDRPAAAARYRQALELDPGSALALFRLGSVELAVGEAREAIALLERALALAPAAGAVRAALARAWNAAGDRDRGRAVLGAGTGRPEAGLPPIEDPVHFRMTERDISSPRLLERARAARGAGRLDDAEVLYRDLAQIRPRDADVLAEFAAVLDQRGRAGEAEPLYRDAVALDPGQALARFGLGVLRAREGNLTAAEYEFRESLETRPDEPQTHAALGDVLLRQRRFEPALAALERVRRLDPEDGASRVLAAVALAELGRFEEAWRAIHEAQDLGAEVPEGFVTVLRARHPEPGR